ncbi:hypothetical protein D3C86_1431700 [compost metagenome]
MRHFGVEWIDATIGRHGAQEEIPFADATRRYFWRVGRRSSSWVNDDYWPISEIWLWRPEFVAQLSKAGLSKARRIASKTASLAASSALSRQVAQTWISVPSAETIWTTPSHAPPHLRRREVGKYSALSPRMTSNMRPA